MEIINCEEHKAHCGQIQYGGQQITHKIEKLLFFRQFS